MKKMLIPMFLLVGFIFTETLDQKQTRLIVNENTTIYLNPFTGLPIIATSQLLMCED